MSVYFFPLLLLLIEEAGIELFLPGDFVILFFGYHVARGHIAYWLAFVLLFTAVILGTSVLYYVAYRFGEKLLLKIGKYIHLSEKELTAMEGLFNKYGIWAIIVARHIPGLRIPTVIFAGISKISYAKFLVSSCISVIPWIVFYLSLGRTVGPRALTLFNAHHTFALFMIVPVIIIFIAYQVLKRNIAHEK
jgi:membrane protein DedA with SNARE-associated domain